MSLFRSSQERPSDADTKQLIRLVTRFYGHLNNAVAEIRLDTDHTGESVYPHLDACRKCVQAMRQTSPEGEEIWEKIDSSLDLFEAMVAKGVKLHTSPDLGGKRRAYAAQTRKLGVEAQLQLDAAMDLASDWLGVHLPQK
ncbi:MAG: hypothetical protein R3191_06875 [Anaerolineales bacterium]|nr:hypothetical protein [Anaerolineales bacterium]